MVKWIKDIVCPTRRPYRRPAVKLGVERLEERNCPSTLWLDTDHTGRASEAGNWENGLPSATSAAVFNPQEGGSPDNIEWDANMTCHGISVGGGYNGIFYFSDGANVSTNANFSIGNQSSASLTFYGANNPLLLTSGAAVTVASGGYLHLNGGNTAGVTIFQGDNKVAGEILNNSGLIDYQGYVSTVQGGIQDYIKIPVLNNGVFNVYGGIASGGATQPLIGGQGFASNLNVLGSDNATGNVSWYQGISSAETNLSGGVNLQLQWGYTQADGVLETTDKLPGGETLTVVNNGVYGPVAIAGGFVRVDAKDTGSNPYGVFYIDAATVSLSGEIDVKIAGDCSASDLIVMNGVAGEKLICNVGSILNVTAQSAIVPGKAGRAVLQFGSISNGMNNNNLKVNLSNGLKWNFNPLAKPTEIDVYT